jgi:hypothetical protein
MYVVPTAPIADAPPFPTHMLKPTLFAPYLVLKRYDCPLVLIDKLPPVMSNFCAGLEVPIPTLVPSKTKLLDPETILLEFL